MFYSHEVLTSRRHGVATVWLVATLGSKSGLRKINRKAILNVNIAKACETVLEPEAPLALRLQSNLMFGISKVYAQQCQYVLSDAQAAHINIKTLLRPRSAAELDTRAGKTKPGQLIVQDDPAFLLDGFTPIFDLDLSELGRDGNGLRSSSLFGPLEDQSLQSQVANGSVLDLVIPTSDSGYSAQLHYSQRGSVPVLDQPLLSYIEDEDNGFDPNVEFEFDEEGNILDRHRVESPGAVRTPSGIYPRDSEAINAAAEHVRHEHEEGLLGYGDPVGHGQEDILHLPIQDLFQQALPKAEAFPTNVPADVHSPTSGSSPGSAIAAQAKAPRRRRHIATDNRQQIRNSVLADWNTDYVANMTAARHHRSAQNASRRAKVYAQQVVFGLGVNRIGTLGDSLRQAHPLAMFAGPSIRDLLMEPNRKRALDDDDSDASSQGSSRKQQRLESPSNTGRPAVSQNYDMEDVFAPSFDDDVEVGRRAQAALEEHSSQMPWNSLVSQHGSRQVSRQSSILHAIGGPSSTIGATPKISRLGPFESGPPRPARHSSRLPSSSPLQRHGYYREGTVERLGQSDETAGNLFADDQTGFEWLGPADNVDTQTAVASQWIRSTLATESNNFLGFVKNYAEQATRDDDEGVERADRRILFGDLLPTDKHTRVVAAQGLMHVLALATHGLLQVQQESNFDAEIEIIVSA